MLILFRSFSITTIMFCFLLLGSSGCAPRGETQSLDQILKGNQERFVNALEQTSLDKHQETLQRLATMLEAYSEGRATPGVENDVAQALTSLRSSAGFPSRPALTELASQFSNTDKAQRTEAQRKLMASRVYFLLAQELEGSAFQLVG